MGCGQACCVESGIMCKWEWEGSLFWGWRPGMALWGKGPPQLCATCLIAHLTFVELNQGCLVWAGCTRPTGQAGGLPEAQAAQAGQLKHPSGEEEQELSSCFSQPGWAWAQESTGDGGRGEVSTGIRARCHRVEGDVAHRAVCMLADWDSSLT